MKNKKLIIAILAAIAGVLVLAGLVVMPKYKYHHWVNETMEQVNQTNDQLAENDINAQLDAAFAEDNHPTTEEIEQLRVLITNNKELLTTAKESVKPGTGYWGIDLEDEKAKTETYSEKLSACYDQLMVDMDNFLVLTDVMETLTKFADLDNAMGDEAAITTFISDTKQIAEEFQTLTQGTPLEAEGTEFYDMMMAFSSNLENIITFAKEGKADEVAKYEALLGEDITKMTNFESKIITKTSEVSGTYQKNIEAYQQVIDELAQ